MKVSAFYITKNGKLIEEKDLVKLGEETIKAVVLAGSINSVLPLIQSGLPLTGIVAQASTVGGAETSAIADAFDPLIHTLQDLAEPFSFGFALKGLFMKMQGKESDGNKTMKNAMYGYLTVQFLPEIYDLLKLIKL